MWDPNTDPIYIYNSNFFHSTTWQARTFFCLGHVVTLWQKLLRQNYRTFLKLPNNFWLDQIIGSMIRHRNIDKKAQIRAVLAPTTLVANATSIAKPETHYFGQSLCSGTTYKKSNTILSTTVLNLNQHFLLNFTGSI